MVLLLDPSTGRLGERTLPLQHLEYNGTKVVAAMPL